MLKNASPTEEDDEEETIRELEGTVSGLVHMYPDNFENASFFIRIKNMCVHTRSVFEKILVHKKMLLHSSFAVRNSIKEDKQAKCPRVIPKDPCACSDTS